MLFKVRSYLFSELYINYLDREDMLKVIDKYPALEYMIPAEYDDSESVNTTYILCDNYVRYGIIHSGIHPLFDKLIKKNKIKLKVYKLNHVYKLDPIIGKHCTAMQDILSALSNNPIPTIDNDSNSTDSYYQEIIDNLSKMNSLYEQKIEEQRTEILQSELLINQIQNQNTQQRIVIGVLDDKIKRSTGQ